MPGATYEQIQAIVKREPTWSMSRIGQELGVSRQYISQMLGREGPPNISGVKHGTLTAAARCLCGPCAALRKDVMEALPETLATLRAGKSLRAASAVLGHDVANVADAAVEAITRGQPTLFRELVETMDATTDIRPRVGRPRQSPRRAA